MFCSNCGKQLSDDALFCPNCGTRVARAETAAQAQPFAAPVSPFAPPDRNVEAAQPMQDARQAYQGYQQPGYEARQAYQAYQQPDYQTQQAWAAPAQTKKKRSKGLFIGLGCVLLAALVAGGIWFLNRKSTKDNPVEKLSNPAENSYAALTDYVEELPNLHRILENADALQDADSLRIALDFALSSSIADVYGQAPDSETGVNLELLRDNKDQRMLLQGKVRVEGLEIPLSFYVDEEQLQISLPSLLNEGEVLSLPLKDLPAKWNASALAKLVGTELPEDLDLSGLSDSDPRDDLEEIYGEDWTRFYDSVDVVPYEGTPHFSGSGDTLTLSWDREALKTLCERSDVDLDAVTDTDDISELSQMDLGAVSAQAVIAILEQLDEDLEETQFYRENDMITGVWLKLRDEGDVEIRLCGEENPWEHITISVAETEDYVNGMDIRVVKGGGQLRLEARHTENGEDAGDEPVAIVYNDADGRISFEGEGAEIPEIYLLPVERGFSFRASESENAGMTVTVSGGGEPVRAITDKPTDLLSMSESELQMLIMRIAMKIQGLLQ